jgi:non-ribosomal peptide synthetase component F
MTFAGARAYTVYPDAVLTALKDVTRRAGATMFMTVLAALDVLCWKYTGQRDLVIGSAIADRNRPETEQVIGYFLNMLLLRATIDPRDDLHAASRAGARVRARSLRAPGRSVRLARGGAAAPPGREPQPLMQVSFIYLDFPILETPEYAGLSSSPMDVDNGASRFDLTLACTELPGTGIHSYFEYNSDLYDRAKVEGMLQHLGRILEEVAAHPDRPLGELDLRTDAERAGTRRSRPDRRAPYDARLLHEGVERRRRCGRKRRDRPGRQGHDLGN